MLVVLSYETPELDYFSARALPFLKDLIDRYYRAGVRLNGLYADAQGRRRHFYLL
ncbi:MAG TPA: hypothetical protein PKK20_08495 [Verrucomicrobiota bacterium]|nr:hypothetical protein [Verrucomicrobiota bacterium]